jgi:hypothetical protein
MSPAGEDNPACCLREHGEMARFLPLTAALAFALLAPAAADADRGAAHTGHRSPAAGRQAKPAAADAHSRARLPTTNPVVLSVQLAERYWHGAPSCGTPHIAISPHQLPNSIYEATSSPEPSGSVVEMWTEVQTCTITINASVWPNWHEDDEFFQWFCDSMAHEVGHLFGHLDSGQTNPSSITYPFLDATSPNFDSVPQCRDVTLRYGSQEIRNESIVGR